MPLVRVLTVLFAVYAISRGALRFRRGTISAPELLIWIGLWLGVVVVVLLPALADWLAELFGVERGIDAAFFVAFVMMAYAFFRFYLKLRGVEQEITRLVRRLALERADSENRR